MTKKEQIISKAIEIIKEHSNGIRYSELTRELQRIFPSYSIHTIQDAIWNLDTTRPSKVYKPVRGLFQYAKSKEKIIAVEIKAPDEIFIRKEGEKIKIKEEDFYKPFAEWLEIEQEDCTKAIPLGGNKFKDKWGTPDVIGIYKSKPSDIIKLPTEVTSAEIKIDTNNLVTAFGQACAYKLFSNKSYIVVPKCSPQKDIGKLEALCKIFGIGLVLFDNQNPKLPEFEIRVTAIKHEPDRFFINKYLKIVEDVLF